MSTSRIRFALACTLATLASGFLLSPVIAQRGAGRIPGGPGSNVAERRCSGCNHLIATGPEKPILAKCPGCGARLTNGFMPGSKLGAPPGNRFPEGPSRAPGDQNADGGKLVWTIPTERSDSSPHGGPKLTLSYSGLSSWLALLGIAAVLGVLGIVGVVALVLVVRKGMKPAKPQNRRAYDIG